MRAATLGRQRSLRVVVAALALCAVSATSFASDITPPSRDYFAYICSESEDVVSLVRFGPGGFDIVKEIEVGTFPAEIEGPHGINVSPSGKYWYVSIAHGQPFGRIHKYSTGDDEWQGDAEVGMFPATLDIAGTTGLLYVVNSDFYGDHEPSTISVVETASMTEVAQIDTGAMPHGSRLSNGGKLLYSVNMMDDELVEVDALRFNIKRRLPLSADGESRSMDHGSMDHGSMDHGSMDHGSMDHGSMEHGAADQDKPAAMPQHTMKAPTVEPAWVSKPTASGKLYVAALSGNEIVEVDIADWTVTRRLPTAKGPYNVAVTADEKLLVATYKKSNSVGFWNLETGEEIAKLETNRRIPHGVAITADGLFTFVTVEGVGGEPGTVEVFDNRALQRVATLEVGKQAGGIALWQPPKKP